MIASASLAARSSSPGQAGPSPATRGRGGAARRAAPLRLATHHSSANSAKASPRHSRQGLVERGPAPSPATRSSWSEPAARAASKRSTSVVPGRPRAGSRAPRSPAGPMAAAAGAAATRRTAASASAGVGNVVAPDDLHQPVGADDGVPVEDEHRQQAPRLLAADGGPAAVDVDRDRAQDAQRRHRVVSLRPTTILRTLHVCSGPSSLHDVQATLPEACKAVGRKVWP